MCCESMNMLFWAPGCIIAKPDFWARIDTCSWIPGDARASHSIPGEGDVARDRHRGIRSCDWQNKLGTGLGESVELG